MQGLGQVKTLTDDIATATFCMTDEYHIDHIWRSTDSGKSFNLSNPITHHSAETHIKQLPSGWLLGVVRTVYPQYEDSRNKRTTMIASDDNG